MSSSNSAVLFPAAGLDPSKAVAYYDAQALVDRLSYAGNEAARRYLNGYIKRGDGGDLARTVRTDAADRAKQRVRFFDQYRSYVINYNLGKDMVRQYIESRGGTPDHAGTRWAEFEKLLSSPRLPSGLGAGR